MRIEIDEVFISEGDLKEVITEDGIQYLPETTVVAVVGTEYWVHPYRFRATFEELKRAKRLVQRVELNGTIDKDFWERG